MKLVKRIISALLIAGMVCSMASCGLHRVNKQLPQFSEDDVIYRSAWWCPEPTEEQYDTYAECGLNTVFLMNHNFVSEVMASEIANGKNPTSVVNEYGYYIGTPKDYSQETMTDQSLALAKEKGLYAYLATGNYLYNWYQPNFDIFEEFSIDYSEYYEDTIVGIFCDDEPSKDEFSARHEAISKSEEVFPDKPSFCNLFPLYADPDDSLKANDYTDYLASYCEEVLKPQEGPRIISTDFYPFHLSYFNKWLFNYDLLLNRVHKYDTAFHAFVQSCISETGIYKELSEEQIRLQVNTLLAYGATRYSYFLYETTAKSKLIGLVDQKGIPQNMYYHAQKVNAETESLEHAFMHYRTQWANPLYATDSQNGGYLSSLAQKWEDNLKTSNTLEDIKNDNCILISMMTDEDGNEAFYVVNFFEEETVPGDDANITLTFKKRMKQAALYGSIECYEGETVALTDGECNITLKPGEGILVIPYAK